jgi:hypothetical protein
MVIFVTSCCGIMDDSQLDYIKIFIKKTLVNLKPLLGSLKGGGVERELPYPKVSFVIK